MASEIVDLRTLVGGLELVGAVSLVVGTFVLDPLAGDPLPWRILAVFMGAEGVSRLR